MKVALVLALVACAAAMPSPDPGFVYSYTHPLAYSSYPSSRLSRQTPPPAPPLVYSYGHNLPLNYGYPYGLPYGLPYSYPYSYPYLVKADRRGGTYGTPPEAADHAFFTLNHGPLTTDDSSWTIQFLPTPREVA
nr:uncharacterized protein LOC113817631 [Penaeus vannamei]